MKYSATVEKFTAYKMTPIVERFVLNVVKGGIAGCIVIASGYSAYLWNKRKSVYRKVLKKRNDERKLISDLKNEVKFKYDKNPALYNHILSQTPSNLITSMQDGKLKPEDVLVAYSYKSLSVNEDLNCVTNALREAFDFVQDLALQFGPKLPLHGLPVSLKETISLKGHSTTMGVAKLIDVIQSEDSVIVATLKHCGAIPFVRTNLPQTTLSFESSNPIYGETGNPHNKDFCPGGSSSGEGSIIGAGGSPLGIGTDTGGSIRCPSHLSGICGIKPTENRISLKGVVGPIPGHIGLCTSAGPMAKDVDTLVLAMKSLLCDFMFLRDYYVPPMPFNEPVYESKRPLRIGYYLDNGFLQAAPACERAVLMAKQELEAAGHTLVKFEFPEIELAMKLIFEVFSADNGKSTSAFLDDGVVDKRIEYLWRNWRMNPIVRWVLSKVMGLKYPRLGHWFGSFGGKSSVYDGWELTANIRAFQETFFRQWAGNNLDAIICPSYAVAACPKGSVENACAMMSYTALYNLLNYPAGVVTITKVTEQDIKNLDNYKGHYDDPWDWHIKEISKHSLGMPVSVQCVARPWNDEMCLRVMKEVETLVQKY